jgi:hypothetical protein
MSNLYRLAIVTSAVYALLVPALARAAASTTPPWLQALHAESDALNRHYRLGRYAVPTTAGTPGPPAWLRALEIRSAAMNKRAGLGRYAPAARTPSRFSWHDAALGAAFAAALCLMLAALVPLARNRVRPDRLS